MIEACKKRGINEEFLKRMQREKRRHRYGFLSVFLCCISDIVPINVRLSNGLEISKLSIPIPQTSYLRSKFSPKTLRLKLKLKEQDLDQLIWFRTASVGGVLNFCSLKFRNF